MSSNLQEAKALLVEDDPQVQRILVDFFQENKFKVHAVASAEAALVMMTSYKYSFMLTDVGLPGMNGFELIKKAKRLNPQMLFAITTADAYDFDQSLLKLVDDLILEKPFRNSDFSSLLSKLRLKLSS